MLRRSLKLDTITMVFYVAFVPCTSLCYILLIYLQKVQSICNCRVGQNKKLNHKYSIAFWFVKDLNVKYFIERFKSKIVHLDNSLNNFTVTLILC